MFDLGVKYPERWEIQFLKYDIFFTFYFIYLFTYFF